MKKTLSEYEFSSVGLTSGKANIIAKAHVASMTVR